MSEATQDLHALCDRLGLGRDIAYDSNWSAAADFLQLIVDHALTEKPETVIECSSGATTLMLARCCELNGRGEVFSLENGAEFAANTRAELARFDLESWAQVVDAPLIERNLDARTFQWYDLERLPERPIDMLVIDGPPGFLQRHSRYPALPLLFDRLAEGSTIFLDDAARPDERELVAAWLRAYPTLSHRYIEAERGCSILRKGDRSRGLV